MTDYIAAEIETDNLCDEIPLAKAVAEMQHISAQLAAALNPANVKPTDEQRARILARVMEEARTVNSE